MSSLLVSRASTKEANECVLDTGSALAAAAAALHLYMFAISLSLHGLKLMPCTRITIHQLTKLAVGNAPKHTQDEDGTVQDLPTDKPGCKMASCPACVKKRHGEKDE